MRQGVKEIVLISGKGGTGKTSIAGGFAMLSGDAVLCDCDVDAANLELILNAEHLETHEFQASKKARIHKDKCIECGQCRERCKFEAIHDFEVDPWSCEGCGVCSRLCPAGAVEMYPVLSGHWFVSRTDTGPLVHARLEPGQENSGKLVSLVRQKAREIAKLENRRLIITDGPPGIGCPVIASLSGAEMALIVTEPTLSGFHDLDRVLKVCRHFGVPAAVCINKYDISPEHSGEIEAKCWERDIPVVGKIPYDENVPKAMVQGMPVVKLDCPATREVRRLWEKVKEFVSL
ncbi:MAG TPA: 4Fe-4S binding protein [Firmicutes bacterium]|nr:4Fe-4S binding protein [Candidatus Fermentithermobacillaceae bacterium]